MVNTYQVIICQVCQPGKSILVNFETKKNRKLPHRDTNSSTDGIHLGSLHANKVAVPLRPSNIPSQDTVKRSTADRGITLKCRDGKNLCPSLK